MLYPHFNEEPEREKEVKQFFQGQTAPQGCVTPK